MSIVTGVAGGLFAGPLGARAGVSFMTAGANMWRTWREANQVKIMYKRTGDPKYLAQLNGAFDDKIANSRGLKKLGWKVWNFATSKKARKLLPPAVSWEHLRRGHASGQCQHCYRARLPRTADKSDRLNR